MILDETNVRVRPSLRLQALLAIVLGMHSLISQSFADDPIIFEEAIAPILRQNCVACHHAKKAEGGLSLESFAGLSRGGDSGTIIDVKTVEASILLDRVTGRVEPIMPPIDNKIDAKLLTVDQIAMIKRWIESGALSKASTKIGTVDYLPLSASVQTSYAITMTPDGEWLVFSRGNDLVFQPISDWSQLAEAARQQQIQYDAHRDICFSLATSPDGQRIASGSSGEVKLWRRIAAKRVTEGEIASTSLAPLAPSSGLGARGEGPSSQLMFDGAALSLMAPSNDGSLLATLDNHHRLRLWNTHSASLVQDRTSDRVQTLLSQQRERDAERQKRRIDRWSAKLVELQTEVDKEATSVETANQTQRTAKKEWESKQQELQLILAAIAEQKLTEVTAELDTKKKVASELQPQAAVAKTKYESAQQTLEQSQESHRLIVAAVDEKKAQLAPEPKILEQLLSESERMKKETADLAVSSLAMAFTGDRQRLVSINRQHQLEVYSTQSMQRIAPSIPVEGNFTVVQPIDDRDVLLIDKDQITQRWTIETHWELECTLGPELPGIISDRVNALAFNHDGTKLAIGSGTGSRSGHLAILDLGPPQALNLTPNSVRIDLSEPDFHSDTILGLAYSPDGRTLASCSADKMTKLIELDTFKQIRNFEGHTHHVLGVAWQDDGVNLATTSGDGTVKIWDIETGEITRTLTIGKELTALSFVGRTNRFVSAVIDNTVRLHDISSKDQVRQFGAAQNALYAIVVTPDGRFTIAIGHEGIPRAWQIEDGKLVAEIKSP